jgi:two-component system chemotaxis response regulator CheB
MNKIRVLIVDDSFFMRKVIAGILQADQRIEVVGQASDGMKGLELIDRLQPDVVSLDIEMPGMNGLETLKKVMALPNPPPTVIVSGYAVEGSDLAFKCLSAGAVDIVLKPGGSVSFEMRKVEEELRKKIVQASQVDIQKLKRLIEAKNPHDTTAISAAQTTDGVLVIGSSTGGPSALETILPQIPENFPYPVLVAQHLPGTFAPHFIQRLGSLSQLPVLEATDRLAITPGTIYVARGGTVAQVVRRADVIYFSVKPDLSNFESPSVNQLLQSAAEVYREKTIGIILTGMGSDGLDGAKETKQRGGSIFVQNEATSVVYGMPREVSQAHLADRELPLDKLIPEVVASLTS